MAACGFGASGLKIRTLNFGCLSPKVRALQPLHSLRTRRNLVFDGLVLYHRSNKAVFASQSLDSASITTAPTYVDNKSEDTKSDDAVSTLVPNTVEVESLLTTLCDTSIAEFELKLGGFHLYVMRDFGGQSETPQPQTTAPVITHTVVEAPASNGSASSPSLALAKTIPNSDVLTVLDKAADEGLMILQSPRVGYFRRSRTIKGKRAPPSCKEKSIVKEGQVLCYIEQLGGELPVESDVSGEVVKILKEDGDPVGYGDALIAVLPSFPGIKM